MLLKFEAEAKGPEVKVEAKFASTSLQWLQMAPWRVLRDGETFGVTAPLLVFKAVVYAVVCRFSC